MNDEKYNKYMEKVNEMEAKYGPVVIVELDYYKGNNNWQKRIVYVIQSSLSCPPIKVCDDLIF